MRAAVVGVFFRDRPDQRRAFGRALAEVTHRDERAIEGVLYVAEMASACARGVAHARLADLQAEARGVVIGPELGGAIDRARGLALAGASTEAAAAGCGTSGYVVHAAAFATFGFLRYGDDPMTALAEIISGGGDTDTIAAILGGWLGALHGEAGLPGELISRIHDGPFGPAHLRSLAECLARVGSDHPVPVPRYSPTAALCRNLALYPVVLAHGFRRLVPL